jgi:hypothetical protein
VFAFAPVFIWLAYQLIFGSFDFSQFGNSNQMEPSPHDTLPIFKLTQLLYSLSHSLLAFGIVFLIMFLVFRRIRYSVFGWLFHILIDIPTHSYQFYPTPFLWPFSDWKFNGLSWATPWFMIFNLTALAVVWGTILWNGRKSGLRKREMDRKG